MTTKPKPKTVRNKPIARPDTKVEARLREMARTQWVSEDLEIDADAKVSEVTSSSGWVQAWVWVD